MEIKNIIGGARRTVALAASALAIAGGLIPGAAHAAAAPDRWEVLPATARAFHSATLLADGRVLVAGGCTGVAPTPEKPCLAPTADTEIFNPATKTWTPAGKMTAPRAGHSATLLNDGRVLVIGGFHGDAGEKVSPDPIGVPDGTQRLAETFDPKSNQWKAEAAPPVIKYDPKGPSGAYKGLSKGEPTGQAKDLVDLGLKGSFFSFHRSNTAIKIGAAKCSRSAASPNCGKVLVMGPASVASGLAPGIVQLFDPVKGAWELLPPCPSCTGAVHDLALLPGESVLDLSSDFTATKPRIFDVGTKAWSDAEQPPVGVAGSASIVNLPGGGILTAGGALNGVPTNATQRYNPATKKWELSPGLHHPRVVHATARLSSGNILVVGGNDGSNPASKATAVPPPGSPEANAATQRALATLGSAGINSILGSSGLARPTLSGASATGEVYDSAAGRWADVPQMQHPRGTDPLAAPWETGLAPAFSATALLDGRALVVGSGEPTAELFVPAGWSAQAASEKVAESTKAPAKDNRVLIGALVLGGLAVAFIVFRMVRR